jgi:putative transcriptional regulator
VIALAKQIVFKLQELIDAKEISQRELSRETGIRHPSIQEMCKNETKRLPLDNLVKLCEYFNVGITDIIEIVDTEKGDS